MDIIISLLIVSVLIGIPTWLIVHTVNKADKKHDYLFTRRSDEKTSQRILFVILGDGFVIWSDSFVCSYTLRPPYGFFFNLLFRL